MLIPRSKRAKVARRGRREARSLMRRAFDAALFLVLSY